MIISNPVIRFVLKAISACCIIGEQAVHFFFYSRGHISILDRKRLEAAACICYRIVKDLQDNTHVEHDPKKRRAGPPSRRAVHPLAATTDTKIAPGRLLMTGRSAPWLP